MNIFQKFFQLSKQEGHGHHNNNENQFLKFWPNGLFRVAGHIFKHEKPICFF